MERKHDPLTVYISGQFESAINHSDLTQEALADLTGLSRASIVNMIAGRQAISIKNLYAIAEACKVTPESFLPDLEWYKKHKGKQVKKVIRYEIID